MDLFESKRDRIAFFTLVPLIGLIMILFGGKDFFFGLNKMHDINDLNASGVSSGVCAGGQVVNCVGRFYENNGKAYYAAFGGYFTEREFIYILEVSDVTQMQRLDALASSIGESTITISAKGKYKNPSLPVSMKYYDYLRSFPMFSAMSADELEGYAVPLMLEQYEYKGRAPIFIFGSMLMLFAIVAYIKYRHDGFAYSAVEDGAPVEKAADADINSGMPISEKSMASFMALQETVRKLSEQKSAENGDAENKAEIAEDATTQEAIVPAQKMLAVKEYITKANKSEKEEVPDDKGYRDLQETLNRLRKNNPELSLPVLEKTDRGIVRDLRLTPFSKVKDPREGEKYSDLQDTLLRIRRENPNIGFLDPPDYFYEEKPDKKKVSDLSPLKHPDVNPTEYLPQPKSFEEIVGIEPTPTKESKDSKK